MVPALPRDPLASARHPFEPAARRTTTVFGAPVELVWLPDRSARGGRPTAERPAFRRSIAEGILEREAHWRGDGLCLTPNRYPFAGDQLLLWEEPMAREATPKLLEALFVLAERLGGTGLLNTVGAAASVPRAHAHLTTERLPFLAALPWEAIQPDFLDPPARVEVLRLAAPCPVLAVGLRGDAAARAEATHRLQMARMTAAVNFVVQDGTTWVFPRSRVEIPAPHFPYALGAAELWGRWCFVEEDSYTAATGQDLEAALVRSAMRWPDEASPGSPG